MEHDVRGTDTGYRVKVTALATDFVPPDGVDQSLVDNRADGFVGIIQGAVGDCVIVEKFALSDPQPDDQVIGVYRVDELNYCQDTGQLETRDEARQQNA